MTHIGHEVIRRLRVSSTNTLALELASEGASHGSIVLADSQQDGRGRQGREWASPEGQLNIYMSVILRQKDTPALKETPGLIPLAAGLATLEAINNTIDINGISLKWPNDIMAGGRKLGGILVEARTKSDKTIYAALGIGVNVNSRAKDFPPELKETATSLLMESGDKSNLDTLVRAIALKLEGTLALTRTVDCRGEMLIKYKEACSTLGLEVTAHMTGSQLSGLASDVDAMGRLLIKSPAGTEAVSSADITHLR